MHFVNHVGHMEDYIAVGHNKAIMYAYAIVLLCVYVVQ